MLRRRLTPPAPTLLLTERAQALRALAGVIATGASPRRAVASWPTHAPDLVRGDVEAAARLVRLGAPVARALRALQPSFGCDALALSQALSIHARFGGNAARSVLALAAAVETRAGSIAGGRAAAAGAVLSARMLALLPLLFVPLTPLARAPLFDLFGITCVLVGAALAVVGMVWIERLIPRPDPAGDDLPLLAEVVAAVVEGGIAPGAALAFFSHTSADPGLERAQRLVRLGMAWPAALIAASDRRLVGLGHLLRTTDSLGSTPTHALRAFAAQLRAEVDAEAAAAARRAPVMMVVPLVLCVLPAYVMLGVVPFLRALGF